MRIRTVFILLYFLLGASLFAYGDAGETITYDISPFGYAEYQDLGLVEFRSGFANLTIFKTGALGFEDTEKIYSDPQSYLPLWVERDLSIWMHKEYLTEEYFSKKNKLIIKKFEGGKKTQEYLFEGKGPIHNAILLPFSLRKIPDLKIGSTFDIRLPDEFKVKLFSVEDVTVPAGTFKAYHFTSDPPKFEIWITSDILRLPVKIRGLGGFSYTLVMKKYTKRQ